MTGFKLNEPTNIFCNPYENLDLWLVWNSHQNQKSLILLSTKSLISKLNMMWGNVHFSFDNHGSTTVVLFVNVTCVPVLSALTSPSLFVIKLNEIMQIMHRLFSRYIRFVIIVRALNKACKIDYNNSDIKWEEMH